MGILNIGTQALNANLVALQTIGNNIANVNTVGYSRQNAVQGTVLGQFTGAGYVGKGVSIQTIQRNYDEFLTRQSTLAAATQASDQTRSNYLAQLSSVFQGGTNGIGASVNDMLNAFSDVASAPTDLTARTVALTRIDETARRMRGASQSLDDLQSGVTQSLAEKVSAVNTLAQNIADVNAQIARVTGNGQPPNDLLDKRDQLIRNINRYVQTSSIPADDGTLGIYIGGSQALVLGTQASSLTVATNEFGDPNQSQLYITQAGTPSVKVAMDENRLGGGEISGLLRFQNSDLVEGRNLLGRLTTAITTSLNEQHALGLDLNGQPGKDLFTPVSVDTVLQPVAPANGGSADLHVAIDDVTQLVASDYQVDFSTGTAGFVTRLSDGQAFAFDFSAPPVTVDGLTLTNTGGAAAAGDRFYLKPFASAASNITREFSAPASLAVASPIVGHMGNSNRGSLQLNSLKAEVNPPTGVPAVISFSTATAPPTYSINNVPVGNYVSGQPITDGGLPPAWTLVLQGAPQDGDTFTVQDITLTNLDQRLNGGNATALMNLRDVAMFDGAAMTDGYASLISQIGVRAQSANYTATVSTNIATNAEKDRTGVAGVNLDEEAAKLLQYQQAYQASAKMIQVAQSIFDTLIQTLAR